jgi:hypothetical protein
LGDKVEAAYRRGDGFEKRRLLADEWGGVLRRSQAEAWDGEMVVHLRLQRKAAA